MSVAKEKLLYPVPLVVNFGTGTLLFLYKHVGEVMAHSHTAIAIVIAIATLLFL